MKSLQYILILFLSPLMLFGQSFNCGADLGHYNEEDLKTAIHNYQNRTGLTQRSNDLDSVPLTIHIISTIEGSTDGITIEEVQASVDGANRIYGGAGIFFYICGSPRIIQGAGSYTSSFGDLLNEREYVPNTINIYFANGVFSNNNDPLCGYAQFPWVGNIQSRYVMMQKSCTGNGGLLAHELGHFYGLYHTHTRVMGLELVDGSNCESAGDGLCDTPADPNLGRPGLLNGCTYIGNFVDPNGDPYSPPVNNIMSYAPLSCIREFTPQQWNIIEGVHQNENAYLVGSCDFYPDFGITSKTSELEISSFEDISVSFDLDNVGIEDSYEVKLRIILYDKADERIGLTLEERIVEINPESNQITFDFNLDFPETKTSGDYLLTAEIDSDYEVIERTEANNNYEIEIRVDNSSLDDLTLFPNPSQDKVNIFFRDRLITGPFNIRIFTYNGVQFLEDTGNKSGAEFFRNIDISTLPTGLYFANINFEKASFNHTFKFFKK